MFKLRALVLAATVVVCTLVSGCATVTRGTTQAWSIDSTPSGATVSLSNGERCETPCTLKLKRKYAFSVEVCKVGYHTVNTTVVSQVSGSGAAGMAGNVLIGGLIGVGVDASSGATKDLKPNPMSVVLQTEAPGCAVPNFPAVPDGGQTPEDYQKFKAKSAKKPKPVAAK